MQKQGNNIKTIFVGPSFSGKLDRKITQLDFKTKLEKEQVYLQKFPSRMKM